MEATDRRGGAHDAPAVECEPLINGVAHNGRNRAARASSHCAQGPDLIF
jgi:hypothetical protein